MPAVNLARLMGTRLVGAAIVALTLGAASPSKGLTIAIDYSYDALNFFDSQFKRDRLQAVADLFAYRLLDDLDAITPGGLNTWTARFTNPATGAEQQIPNPSIAADTLWVFAGGRDLGGSTLGRGGAGSYSAMGFQDWITTVSTRGEGDTKGADAVDFAPWGGSLTFTTSASVDWNFSAVPPAAGQSDFFSVAMHEMGHLLGFGTSDSWFRLVSGNSFIGPASTAEYDGGGYPSLSADHSHWSDGTTDAGQETAMDPSIVTGTRKPFTALDYAALTDIGWMIGPPPPLQGDLNGDSVVNIFDVNLVSAHWGTTDPAGDANGDMMVNIFDVNFISLNWTYGGGAAPVPEPAAGGLALLAAIAICPVVRSLGRAGQ